MKIKVEHAIVIVILLCMAWAFVGCSAQSSTTAQGTSTPKATEPSTFVKIETYYDRDIAYSVVYDRTTKVMYTVSAGSDNMGNFAPIYNEDGSFRLYEGDE